MIHTGSKFYVVQSPALKMTDDRLHVNGHMNGWKTTPLLHNANEGPWNMSHVTRKSVFGVCDMVRLKLACSASEARLSLEILDLAGIRIILSKQWTTKALIRLHRCADWSALLLFAYGIKQVSHDMAHIIHGNKLAHKLGNPIETQRKNNQATVSHKYWNTKY